MGDSEKGGRSHVSNLRGEASDWDRSAAAALLRMMRPQSTEKSWHAFARALTDLSRQRLRPENNIAEDQRPTR
jgi:hypothetical protein